MKRLNVFLILFIFILLLLAPSLAAALFTQEATEIPYQINNSDRIVIGTVSEVNVADYYTNNTITVKEWLYNPLPKKTIIVRTNIGANASTEDEAEFTDNESVLLMLKDQRPDKGVFYMSLGFLGKHPPADRNAVIEELKAQGKWPEENQTGNSTNETEVVENRKTVAEQEENSGNTQPKTTPFMNPICVLAAMLGATMCIRRKE